MLGTSKFGGGQEATGDDNNDSFDEAFEKGDESQPPEEELEDFMVKPKVKRP